MSRLMIAPHFAPMQDGLGHYSTIFFHELNKTSSPTFVLTNLGNQNLPNVYPVIQSWKFAPLLRAFKEFDLYQHDEILIQYVPFMFQRRGGINFSFCFFILYLALFRNQKIMTMAHEINYPFEWKLKSSVMYVSHLLMMKILLWASEKVLVSSEYFVHQLKQHQVKRLPVGSNIPVMFPLQESHGRFRMVMFGKLHPAKNVPWQLSLCLKAFRSGLDFEVRYVGETFTNLMRCFSHEEELDFKKFLTATGFVSDQEVSRELSEADALLAYFVDGLSTRRGSVMAALEHGLLVLSTKGEFTDHEFLDREFVTLLSTDEVLFEEGFMAKMVSLTSKEARQDKQTISDFYGRHFSWKKIVADYLELEKA